MFWMNSIIQTIRALVQQIYFFVQGGRSGAHETGASQVMPCCTHVLFPLHPCWANITQRVHSISINNHVWKSWISLCPKGCSDAVWESQVGPDMCNVGCGVHQKRGKHTNEKEECIKAKDQAHGCHEHKCQANKKKKLIIFEKKVPSLPLLCLVIFQHWWAVVKVHFHLCLPAYHPTYGDITRYFCCSCSIRYNY